MFEIVFIIVLLAVAVVVAAHLLSGLARGRSGRADRRTGGLGRLVMLALLVSIAVLACTSFWPVVVEDGSMSGWYLWAHLLAAGLFAVALASAAVLWAEPSRFGQAGPAEGPRFAPLKRVGFWIVLIAGMVSLATMLLGMLRWFSAGQIETLIAVHRYAGLAVVAGFVLQFYASLAARIGIR